MSYNLEQLNNLLDKYLSLGYERGFIHKNKERK